MPTEMRSFVLWLGGYKSPSGLFVDAADRLCWHKTVAHTCQQCSCLQETVGSHELAKRLFEGSLDLKSVDPCLLQK